MKLPDPPEEKPKDEKKLPKYETNKAVPRSRTSYSGQGNANRKTVSLFSRRPAAKPQEKAPAPEDLEPATPSQAAASSQVPNSPALNGREMNPGLKLRAVEAAGKNIPPAQPPVTQAAQPSIPAEKPKKGFSWASKKVVDSEPFFDEDFFTLRPPQLRKSLRAGRKLGGIISLVVNVILLGVVLVLMARLQALNTTLNNVLGGLYENFVNMDNATIVTTIYIEDMPIPVDFTLPVVQEETYVTLTRSVTIYNARVGILSEPTTVTLPAGTALPVSLNMTVPVQTTLLVDIQVPVNIDLAHSNPSGDGQVGLHDAFLGLQNTIGPFYCLFKPDLTNAAGGLVCQNGSYSYQDVNP